MYRQTLITLGLGVLSLGSNAYALNTYTLKDALDTGMQNSPTLQKADAARSEGKWKGIEGYTVFMPTINLNGSYFFEKKYQLFDIPFQGINAEIPSIFPTSSASLDARWLIFDGFGNVDMFKGAQAIKNSSESNYQWVIFQTSHDIVIAYKRVVAAKKLEDVSEQNLNTLQNHLDQTKKLQTGGLATNYDVLRVESQLSEAQVDLLQAKDNILIAQENLGKALGLNEAADATDSDLEVPNNSHIKDITYNRDTNKRLDLDALEKQVEASDFSQTNTSRFWVPKLYMTGEYTKYNNLTDSFGDWKDYRSAWSVGLALTWDIFNPRDFALSRQEHYRTVQIQKTLVDSNLQAPVDFGFWKKRYLYSAALYDSKKVDLDRATETVRLAQAGFKAGVRTTTEVLDAELELFRARAGIVNSQLNCIEAKQKLELSLGETL